MSMSDTEVIQIIKKVSGNENVDIDSTLVADIGINSLSFIQLVVELERCYDIEFPDEFLDMSKFVRVKNLVDFLTMQGVN